MSKISKRLLWLLLPLCIAGAGIMWRGEIQNLLSGSPSSPPPLTVEESAFPVDVETTPDFLATPSHEDDATVTMEPRILSEMEEALPADTEIFSMESRAFPEGPPGEGEILPEDVDIPSSPPLPRIDPAATREERARAFHMEESIDHIVRRDEPFDVEGKDWTLDGILGKLAEGYEPQELVPFIKESTIGSSVRRPIREPLAAHLQPDRYYGVRVVRPGENIWTIHYGIFREYMSRRGVDIPRAADRPLDDGRSSGVGRLLKFMEEFVLVYNIQQNERIKNIHLIYPSTAIVFFNISDLFGMFDQLDVATLRSLRYLYRSGLVIEKPQERIPLMEGTRTRD